jgi:hypothetical protein
MHKSLVNRGNGRQRTWSHGLVGNLECLTLTDILESALCLDGVPGKGEAFRRPSVRLKSPDAPTAVTFVTGQPVNASPLRLDVRDDRLSIEDTQPSAAHLNHILAQRFHFQADLDAFALATPSLDQSNW